MQPLVARSPNLAFLVRKTEKLQCNPHTLMKQSTMMLTSASFKVRHFRLPKWLDQHRAGVLVFQGASRLWKYSLHSWENEKMAGLQEDKSQQSQLKPTVSSQLTVRNGELRLSWHVRGREVERQHDLRDGLFHAVPARRS